MTEHKCPKQGCPQSQVIEFQVYLTMEIPQPALVLDHLLTTQNLFCYNLSVATCPSVAHLTKEFGSVFSVTVH